MNTTGDFWRMVWEQKSSAIVMLTQLLEAGRVSSIAHELAIVIMIVLCASTVSYNVHIVLLCAFNLSS